MCYFGVFVLSIFHHRLLAAGRPPSLLMAFYASITIINLRRTSSNHELRVAHMDNNISVEIASDSVHGEGNQNLNGPQRSHNINLFTLTWIYFDPSLYSISTQMVVIDLKAQVIITKAFIVSFVVIVVLVFVDLLVAIRFLVGQSIITKIEFVVFMATFSECKTRAGKAV